MDRVGIRELRQNLSVYVRRVVAGETLEVTEFGHPVARLTPLPREADPIARLDAEGRLAQRARSDLLDMEAPPALGLSRTLSEILEEVRGERL